MKVKFTSIFVPDQAKALAFYTDVLGFVKKEDVPLGEYRWLTVVSPDEPMAPSWFSSPTSTQPFARSRTRSTHRHGSGHHRRAR
jgi:catechol 2,3-dioxygenase-like lactoylglutathione lyase family enzyme